jgi:prolyl-tRNA synthetase
MVLADTGEDAIASCTKCSYAANIERAEIKGLEDNGERGGPAKQTEEGLKKVSTPGMKSVEEVSGFLKVEPSKLIKTLVYTTDTGTVLALVRGDMEINEAKLSRALGSGLALLADDAAVKEATGAPTGFAGPVGLSIDILADFSVRSRTELRALTRPIPTLSE